jgi:hypothetical protein
VVAVKIVVAEAETEVVVDDKGVVVSESFVSALKVVATRGGEAEGVIRCGSSIDVVQ